MTNLSALSQNPDIEVELENDAVVVKADFDSMMAAAHHHKGSTALIICLNALGIASAFFATDEPGFESLGFSPVLLGIACVAAFVTTAALVTMIWLSKGHRYEIRFDENGVVIHHVSLIASKRLRISAEDDFRFNRYSLDPRRHVLLSQGQDVFLGPPFFDGEIKALRAAFRLHLSEE